MSDRKSTLTAVLVDAVSGPAQKITAEITRIGESARNVAEVMAGIGQGIGQKLFEGFTTIADKLTEIIPDLIHQGNDYLEQLRTIQLETGMTAEQTSALAGAMSSLGIPVTRLEPLLARFSKQLEGNEDKFKALGVATRDSGGKMLDAAQIIENLRHAVQAHGESLLSTAAAQELFGKSGSELLPYLQKTDEEIQNLNENTRRWGGIMSQEAIDGAESFKNSVSSFFQGITDIGANIAAALDPYLRQFVDAFARFVQAHLNEIINFAVGVTNAIIGFISGIFGITDVLTSTDAPMKNAIKNTGEFSAQTKKAAGSQDAFTQSINAQMKAIDAHTRAIEEAAARRHAARERERLQQSVTDARAQLKDLQGNSPFLGGLSAAEQVLAVQKHGQDIIDAKKKVKEAEQSLGDFEADQKDRAERELLSREKSRLQESLAAHRLAQQQIAQGGLRMAKSLDASVGGALTNIGIKTEEFGKTAADTFKGGVDAAQTFLNILLGTPVHEVAGISIRSGGVVGALQTVGGILQDVGKAGSDLVTFVKPIIKLFEDIAGAINWVAHETQNFGADLHKNIVQPLVDFVDQILHLYAPVPNLLPGHAAGGWVGLHGPELSVVGEEGPEYIVPNGGKMPGGHTSVHMHFDFLSMPSDDQIRKLTDQVSSRLAFTLNHAPVTSLPNGSF